MLSQLGAVQMAVDTHLAVLATVALYVILCIEVRCPPSTLCTLSTLYLPIYLYYPLPTSPSTAHSCSSRPTGPYSLHAYFLL